MTQAVAVHSVGLAVGGMTCAACANRVERKLNKLGERQLRDREGDGVVGTAAVHRDDRHCGGEGRLALPPQAISAALHGTSSMETLVSLGIVAASCWSFVTAFRFQDDVSSDGLLGMLLRPGGRRSCGRRRWSR
jgi:cation transport ATPase